MARMKATGVATLVCLSMLFALMAPALAVDVVIDIRPDTPHNSIKAQHVIVPVGIMGSATFNVNDVDVDSLCFGSATKPKARNCTREAGDRYIDANGDGYMDLVVKFEASGGINRDDTTACMNGKTLANVAWEACDMARVGR